LIEGKLEEAAQEISTALRRSHGTPCPIAGWEPFLEAWSADEAMQQYANALRYWADLPEAHTTWELRWRPEVTSPKPWSTFRQASQSKPMIYRP